jgi:cytochrome c-type biogenesis protein CcmE
MVVDSLGERVKVVYHSAEPESFEMSDRIVLEGTIKNDYFDCDRILLKCPSKYSDDPETSGQHLPSVAGTTQP